MSDHLSQTFAALADPTRRAMLARLSKGEACVSDLARPFLKDMSLPAVTKHLKVLERAGLITKTREAQFRPCKLNGDALKNAADWMEQYRRFWEESFDRLEAYLKTVTSKNRRGLSPFSESAENKGTVPLSAGGSQPAKGKKHGRQK
jgi:DNA-binding transcriptional ArsR family regulator